MSRTAAVPAVAGGAWEVAAHHGREGCDHLAPEWQALASQAGVEPLFGYAWIRAHIAAFEREEDVVLLALRQAGRLVGVLPLISARERVRGVPVRMLRAAAGVNTVRFDMSLAAGGADALAALWQYLLTRPQWDCILLPQVPAGGWGEAWVRLSGSHGLRVAQWTSKQVPFIAVTASEAGVGLGETSSDFRSKLRWSRRRLEERGALRLERLVLPAPDDMQSFYDLEAAGHKGTISGSGAALLRKGPQALLFYQRLIRLAGEDFVLHRLWSGPRLVAASLGMYSPRAFYLLKTTYDEQVAKFSPGHLLTEEIVTECAAAGRERFDFCGEAFAYEARWTSQRLPHSFWYIFRRTWAGRAAYSMKFGMGERLRQRFRGSGHGAAEGGDRLVSLPGSSAG